MLKTIDHLIKKTNHKFDFIDLGGGMGIDYEKNNKMLNYKIYSSLITKFLKKRESKIILEPGRKLFILKKIKIKILLYWMLQ